MELLQVGLVILGLAAFFVGLRKLERFQNLLLFLFTVLIGQSLLPNLNPDGVKVIEYGNIILAINFIASSLGFFNNFWKKAIFPIAGLILIIALFIGTTAKVDGGQTMVLNKFVIIGLVLATLSTLLGSIKKLALNKFEIPVNHIDFIMSIFIGGVSLFLGAFGTPILGPYLVAVMFLSSNFYSQDRSKYVGFLMLTYIAVIHLLPAGLSSEINLLQADVFLGITFGAFAAMLIYYSNKAENKRGFLVLFSWVLAIILPVVLLLNEIVYENLGGVDAFGSYLFTFALVYIIKGGNSLMIGIVAIVYALGMYLPNLIFEKRITEQAQIQSSIIEEEVVVVNRLPLTGIEGEYTINPDESVVSFNLGEKSVTKGSFKKISGKVDLQEDLTKSSINVILKMEDFTTANKFRDQSINSKEYLNSDKFPELKFNVTSINVSSVKNEYTATGEFEMLGVKQPLEVTLYRIEKDGEIILEGKGEIDRTLYGMKPSVTEGNVVRFEYKAVLQQ